ncbi:MAG: hypothetical protein LC804_17785 [Acidobacteria bacterium]|nr:hypothetical protein [Acidobacteriota bacterium]
MRIKALASSVLAFLLVSCSTPVEPTSSTTLDRFVVALRQQGLTVSLAGQIAPSVNGFFSVPADQVRVNDSRVNAFVYPSADAAAAEAALISKDGQPSPTVRVTWVSTPRFYRQDAMIVLYVGCAADIVEALQKTVGPPIALGGTPCDLGR